MPSMLPLLLIGGGAVMLMGGKKKKKRSSTALAASDPYVLLKELSLKMNNPDLDPTDKDLETLLLEIQLTYQLETTGTWTRETEAQVKKLLAE